MKYLVVLGMIPLFAWSFTEQITPDFSVIQLNGSDSGNLMTPVIDDCRAHISKVICLVDNAEEGQERRDRPCLEGSQDYAHYFEEVHDAMPGALQKMFCSLRAIYVEREWTYGTAYAGVVRDENGKLDGAVMGMRQSVLDNKITLTKWATWKDQLNFGATNDTNYTTSYHLPHHYVLQLKPVSDFLYTVVAHEFGHMFDFAGNLNETSRVCREPEEEGQRPECQMAQNTWGSLSWSWTRTPLEKADFQLRDRLCFYWCEEGKALTYEDVIPAFHGLEHSPFVSLYAATNPWDDFAETLAYYMFHEELFGLYMFDTLQGPIVYANGKLFSPQFADKLKFLEDFLSREDIVYP